MREEKIFLDSLRVPGWVWKLNWHKINIQKEYTLYWFFTYTWKPSQEDEDPKKWQEEETCLLFRQRNNKYVKNWQDRRVWTRGSKWWSKWDDKDYFIRVCVYRSLSPNCCGRKGPFPRHREGSCPMQFYELLEGRKVTGEVRMAFLASAVSSTSFSWRYSMYWGARFGVVCI